MGDEKIQYPADHIDKLRKRMGPRWEADSVEGREKLSENMIDLATFGDLPALRGFGQVYLAAQQVYTETLLGAEADLASVISGLESSVEQMRASDERAGAAFLLLQRQWQKGTKTDAGHTKASQSSEAQKAAEAKAEAESQVKAAPEEGGGTKHAEGVDGKAD